ncbi:MAG: carbonic anhydrase [Gemmatimonadota bacterium]
MSVSPPDAAGALEILKRGNARFVDRLSQAGGPAHVRGPLELPDDQHPTAVVLGCSDARVPAEIVFDQGLGDLFVIRVAGNIIAPSLIGSVEFAVSEFGTRLVLVMGHTRCGTVQATIDEIRRPTGHSANLASIVDRIRPHVESYVNEHREEEMSSLWRGAVRANVHASVEELRTSSSILEKLIAEEGLMVIGAEYCLETGVVTFLEADEE